MSTNPVVIFLPLFQSSLQSIVLPIVESFRIQDLRGDILLEHAHTGLVPFLVAFFIVLILFGKRNSDEVLALLVKFVPPNAKMKFLAEAVEERAVPGREGVG
jgi:hypothetical protein